MAMVNVKAVTPRKGVIVHQVKTWTFCRHSHCNVNGKCFCTGDSCWVIYRNQMSTHPMHSASLNTFEVSVYQNWTVHSQWHTVYCHLNIPVVQYRVTTCSPHFVVVYRGWQYVDSGCTVKHHIIGNFCLQTSMGAKWGWCCIRVWLYFLTRICSGKL